MRPKAHFAPNATSDSDSTRKSISKKIGEASKFPLIKKKKETKDSELTFHLCCILLCVAFGASWQHGFHIGVLNTPAQTMKYWLGGCPEFIDYPPEKCDAEYVCCDPTAGQQILTEDYNTYWGLVISLYSVGGFAGSLSVGLVMRLLGRRNALFANGVVAILGSILLFLTYYLPNITGKTGLLICGRIVIGFNNGICAGVAPILLTELAPKSFRGASGTLYQLGITMSILVSQVLGINGVMGGKNLWPYLLLVPSLVIAISQMITLAFIVPESPKYLLIDMGAEEDARKALKLIRKDEEVEAELDAWKKEKEESESMKAVGICEIFKNAQLRQPLFIAVMLMFAQQLTGINVIMYYSTAIFKEGAGLPEGSSFAATVTVSAISVVVTIFSTFLVDVAGRKLILLTGLVLMFLSSIGLFTALKVVENYPESAEMGYFGVFCVCLYVIGFGVGLGPIPWFFVAELFDQSGKPMAATIATSCNWLGNFVIGMTFLPLKGVMNSFVFLIYIFFQLVFIAYIVLIVPETKGRTIEEMKAVFMRRKPFLGLFFKKA